MELHDHLERIARTAVAPSVRAGALNLLATLYGRLNDHEAQFQTAQAAMAADPTNLASRLMLAVSFVNRGQLEEASRLLTPIAGLPGEAGVFAKIHLSVVHRRLGDPGAGRRYLELALEHEPRGFQAIEAAQAAGELGLFFDALELFARAVVSLRPDMQWPTEQPADEFLEQQLARTPEAFVDLLRNDILLAALHYVRGVREAELARRAPERGLDLAQDVVGSMFEEWSASAAEATRAELARLNGAA